MRNAVYAIAMTALAMGWTATAHAQAEHYRNKPIELNVHAGGLAIEDGDTEVLAGARLAYNMANGFGIGGNFDWAQAGEDDFDINLYLYSADVSYTFPSNSQLHFFVSGGVGAATISPGDDLEEFGVESQTELLVPVGGGLKWFNRTNDPTWAIRADVKDQIIFAGDDETTVGGVVIETEGETTHNFEFSAGVSFFFGGGM